MTKHPYADRGRRLVAAITASKFTQSSLAERLGISRQAMNDLTSGRAPGTKHMATIAELLEVPVGWLAEGGDDTPEHLLTRIGEASESLATPTLMDFYNLMNEAGKLWTELRDRNPREYETKLQVVPPRIRSQIHEARFCWKYDNIEDLRTALELVGVVPGDEASFLEGHKLNQMVDANRHMAASSANTDRSLPLEHFATIRGALLVLKAERTTFGRSARDAERALELLWSRQLSGNWPAESKRRLEAQREQDLGPDLSKPIE